MKTMRTLHYGCVAAAIAVLATSCTYKPTEIHERDPGVSVTTYTPGYTVRTLPSGYQTRVVSGTTYYTFGGTYFRPHSNGYVVVAQP